MLNIVHQGTGRIQQTTINPMDSSEQSEIRDNIAQNLDLIGTWLEPSQEQHPETTAWLVGSGKSLWDCKKIGFISEGIFERNPSHRLFVAKHALPFFSDWTTVPISCVALDPRPIEGRSTHGKKRETLYASAPPQTVFYIASMTNPSVTKYLIGRGMKVIGWHASTNSLQHFQDRIKVSIGGGTNSTLRAVGLLKECLGITRFRLLGVDSSIELPEDRSELDNPNSNWYTEKDPVTGFPLRIKSFYGPPFQTTRGRYWQSNEFLQHWTTGELAAQTQDLEALLSNRKGFGIDLKIVGTDKGRSIAGQIGDMHS